MIDQETIQRIMDAARIEEVIGDFVSLKKRGANHIGCCPFHNEKTPSFYVSPSKGIFKCFGCGEAGDVVAFLKKHEHFTYPEALRYLAQKYNIEIQEEEQTQEQKERQNERDALFHVSEFAQKYFADLLYNDEMGRAVGLSYFHSRGLSDEVIKNFGLGYCLDEWSNFTDHARRNGYSDAVLEKTGLTIFREAEDGQQAAKRRSYDRFRGRVMFPIYSISGRVLGFSGRVLSSEKQAAKYVNSPDSDIYNKSRTLYGLYQARSAIAKANKCYLVEGNIDVISMHQSGVENTVASCGTSLTTEQIRLIKRYTPNVTVLYDGDSAGIKAALRAVNLLFAEGMHVRVVLFPDGEDPDSYAQKYGSSQLQDYLASHEDNFVMFKTRVLLDGVKNDPIRKAELVKETVNTIALVPDLLERTEYISQCAHLLNVPEEALASELAKAVNQNRLKAIEERGGQSTPAEQTGPAEQQPSPDTPSEAVPVSETPAPGLIPQAPAAERHLIQLLLNYGDRTITQAVPADDGTTQEISYTVAEAIVGDLQGDELSFTDPLCQKIYLYYCDALARGDAPDASHFITIDDDALRTFAISLMLDTLRISNSWREKQIFVPSIEDNLQADLTDTLLTFKLGCINARIADNAQRFRFAQDDESMFNLIAEKKQLIELRRKIGMALHRVID
ncbi:MAG: DNA primase [Bacteroidales bacterium]|nr:DNA primase [Bacteroidales bacterium]